MIVAELIPVNNSRGKEEATMATSNNRNVRTSTKWFWSLALLAASGAFVWYSRSHPWLKALIDIPGLLLVVGGTIGATAIYRPFRELISLIRRSPQYLRSYASGIDEELRHILRVADALRMSDIRGAEQEVGHVNDMFVRNGLQLAVDRVPPTEIDNILRWQIANVQKRFQDDAQVLRTMGHLAPAFGMLGTLIGLVGLLTNLGDSPLSEIGTTMAFAITTTLYGILFASVLLKPLAMRVEQHGDIAVGNFLRLKEGILLVATRQNPLIIRDTLLAVVPPSHRPAMNNGGVPRAA
jgi:chemotaxis protein MotA